jgi:hypothetical protein
VSVPLVVELAGAAEEPSGLAGAPPPTPSAFESDGVAAGLEALSPLLVQLGAPLLRDWIIESRNSAVRQGVAEIPPAIRMELSGYVPEAVLDHVRWRVGGAGEESLQQNSFSFGHALAITLDYVVVFRDHDDALDNSELWVHELYHVMQFGEWGIEGFAARYLANSSEIESEAARYRWAWVFR